MTTLQAPASLTAQYLYGGAYFFSNSTDVIPQGGGCPECLLGLGRLVYSTGVAVVAPLGMLYHIAAAAKNALQSCCTEIDDESEELSTRAWQHIGAMAYDFLGFLSVLVTTVVALSVILTFVYGDFGFLRGLIPLLVGALVTQHNPFEITLFAYMVNGNFFGLFLSESKEGGTPSQQEAYAVQLAYDRMSSTGAVLNTPLTDDEIGAYAKIASESTLLSGLPPDYARACSLLRFLRDANRIAPRHLRQREAFLAKEPAVREAWETFWERHPGLTQEQLEARRDELNREFATVLLPIFADLPPIDPLNPLPAAPGGPATA